MNEQARKQARRAELESVLLGAWKDDDTGHSFAKWLEVESKASSRPYWQEQAIELIVLYGEVY